MKHRWMIAVMAVLLSLGGCSTESAGEARPPVADKDLLVFGVEKVETRGVSTTEATIQEFGVFCFDTGYGKWAAVAASATPNKLFNQPVRRIPANPSDLWVYDPLVSWEAYENKLHSFFAYSPMAKGMQTDSINGAPNVDGNNLKLQGTQATTGIPTLAFELLDEVAAQIDLLVAKERLDLSPIDVVRMDFTHALTRIGFKAFSEMAGTYIEKIEIEGIPYKGTLQMTSPAGWTVANEVKSFTLSYGNGTPVLAPEENPVDISAPGRYLLAIPQDWTTNTTAKVKVRFRQNEKTFEKEFLIGSTGESWTQNRSITYVLNLNGEPNNDLIVDRVIIVDWKMAATIDTDLGVQSKKYWLHFDANGGSATSMPEDKELETGTLYKIPNTIPKKSDATFNGWNTAADDTGTTYQPGQRVPIDEANVTLYARWQPTLQP